VTLPLVLGNDPSGIVVEVGQDVEQPRINDRVVIFRGGKCAGTHGGRPWRDPDWSKYNSNRVSRGLGNTDHDVVGCAVG
jgi:threonine dehydrogenase-like Zn-dependent dehydrogenase